MVDGRRRLVISCHWQSRYGVMIDQFLQRLSQHQIYDVGGFKPTSLGGSGKQADFDPFDSHTTKKSNSCSTKHRWKRRPLKGVNLSQITLLLLFLEEIVSSGKFIWNLFSGFLWKFSDVLSESLVCLNRLNRLTVSESIKTVSNRLNG
jgi:hypothetical protein